MPATLNPPKPASNSSNKYSATPAPPESYPRPLVWDCALFHNVGDAGYFEGKRVILIDGVLLEQGPMNPPHAIAISLGLRALGRIFQAGWDIRVQVPLVLGLRTDPLPDFAVVSGDPRDYTTHPSTAALVVEVSDTTLKLDTTDKAMLYAEAGIADYWVIDVENHQLIMFRNPQGTRYKSVQTLQASDTISPLAAPGATIQVADLLP